MMTKSSDSYKQASTDRGEGFNATQDVTIKSLYIYQLPVSHIVVSSSSLRNVRLSTVITTAAGAGVVVVVLLLLLSNINVNNYNTLLQSKSVFAQLEEEDEVIEEEEGGGVVAQAEAENATATTTTTSEAATNETTTAAASPARNNMTGVQFLFIQSAQSGSVSEVNATTSTLELSDVSDKTIMFSDRPDRIVSSVNTTDFIGNWSTGPNSFAVDPPNAVLVLDDEVEQRQELAVIELYNPEYDSEANTLKYDISAENASASATTTSIDLPSEFGQSTLVIDEDNQQGRYVPGQQPNVSGGVTKPQFQNDTGPPAMPPTH